VKRFDGLRLRLFVVVLLALVPFSVLVFVEARADHAQAMADARNRAQYLASSNAQIVGGLVERVRQSLSTMSEAPEITGHSWPAAAEYCRRVMARNPEYVNVAIADDQGDVRASAVTMTAPVNIRDREYYYRAILTNDFSMGGYIVGRITHKPSVSCSYPVRDRNGRAWGVVYISLDVGALQRELATYPTPAGAITTLFDDQGRIIAREPEGGSFVGRVLPDAAVIRRALAHYKGTATLAGLDAVPRVYGFQPAFESGPTGLYVAAGLDEGLLLAAERQGYTARLVTLSLSVAFVLGLAGIASWVLVLGPLRSLRTLVGRLSKGDLDARSDLPPRGDEIGDLASECDAMAEAIGAHVAELTRSEQRYRDLARLLPVGVFVLDAERRVVFANQVGLSMLGVESLPTDGLPFVDRMGGVRSASLGAYLDAVAHGERPAALELTIADKDGGEMTVEFAGAPHADDGPLILGIAHDVTERKAVEQIKSDFVSMVSHELRTPLTSIIGFTQLLARPEHQGADDVIHLSGRIGERAEHMNELVEGLLRVLQAEMRSFCSEKRVVDVGAVVRQCIAALDVPATHVIELDAPSDPQPVECDPQAVAYAVSNLLGNAVKFSPDGGTVHVRVSQGDGRTRIRVADEGIGVPEEARETIFDRFVQADMSSTREFGGFGLGLFIVKQVAEAHDGSVTVAPGECKGSVFTLELSS
jgi:PAS domain S-box-containing protein